MTTEAILDLFHQCKSVSTDTRKVQPDDLFFALKGDRFDGNQFAQQALDQGARAVVIDDPAYLVAGDPRYHLVADSLRALQDLGRARRREFSIPFLGITGSNGKTTTKELIYSVLQTEKSVYATPGNFNNHIGVPLTLLGLPNELDLAIIEMGANQPGDIRELAEIAEPTHGLLTNIGQAHLERFGSLDGVRKTKGELFDFIAQQKGHIFLNLADERVVQAAGPYERFGSLTTFGAAGADYQLEIQQMSLEGMKVRVSSRHWTEALNLESNLSGAYNATNILVATMIGDYFGISKSGIQAGIAAYVPLNNRSQIVERGGKKIWLDAYNANPSSMQAAIRHVCSSPQARVALILGDMLEMGEQEKEVHTALGHFINPLQPVVTIGIGPRMRSLVEVLEGPGHWFESARDAQATVGALTREAEIILLKGSRGMALERLLEYLP